MPSKSSDYSITLIVNNVGDLGKAMAKSFGSGLTFGLIGTMVSDYYEIKISYTDNEGSTTVRDYKHAMHSTIGNAKGPAGVLPDTADNAFGKIIEETLFNFISDMQKLKKLSFILFIQIRPLRRIFIIKPLTKIYWNFFIIREVTSMLGEN